MVGSYTTSHEHTVRVWSRIEVVVYRDPGDHRTRALVFARPVVDNHLGAWGGWESIGFGLRETADGRAELDLVRALRTTLRGR